MTITELTPKSEPAQRFEVFTGAGRRRIWTAEEKARIPAANTPVIEIAIGEARVLVPPDIDPVRLTAVLRAVRKAHQ